MDDSRRYLDPATLARVKDLELRARRVIEGLVSGSHKSPLQGVSVEFAEHREYVPGDDTRHIDWKLFGKTDRFFLKRYEQETNLVCHLVIDSSQSMAYKSDRPGAQSKLEYAAQIAACLAYLVVTRQDSVGMTFFEDKIRYFVGPSSQPSQLKQLFHLLTVCQPANLDSRIGPVLDELAERLHKRSLVVVLTDAFGDVNEIVEGLRHLRYKRHDVAVFHVLDPAELTFPFRDLTLFKGLERMPELVADPKGLRKAYLESFGRFCKSVEVGCRGADADYRLARTDVPLAQFLSTYLAERGGRVG